MSSPQQILITFLLLLLPGVVLAQKKEFEELQEKEARLGQITNDSILADEYMQLSLKYMYIDSAKSKFYSNKYFRLEKEKNDSVGLGLYYHYKAIQLIYNKSYAEAAEAARICMAYTRENNLWLFLEATQILMRALHYKYELEQSEKAGLEIIREKKYEKLPLQLGKIYYNLGLITMNRMKDSSVFYFKKAIFFISKEPDNRVLLPCYHNISCIYRDRNNLDSAFKYASLSYELSKDSIHYNNVDFISPANNYQQLLARLGRHEEAQKVSLELQMRQYDLKVKSIIYPEVSKQVGYLEYLRYGQRMRFTFLLIILAAILIVFSFFIIFYRKLKKKQIALAKSFELNQILLKETNHRVKNNYQTMLSMLNVHAADSKDTLNQFVEQTRARIASMAKVHELFLQNPTGSKTDVQIFFEEIIMSLENSLNLKEKKISILIQSKVKSLKTSKIITLGLIINELVVNAVKYAFEGQKEGIISLSLDKDQEGYLLTCADNGQGIKTNHASTSGAGMSIVFSLAKQLKGEAKVIKKEGTTVEIRFKV